MTNIRDHSDFGFKAVVDTTALTSGNYFGIQVLEAAVISSITFTADYSGDTGIQTVTLPAGIYIPARFTTLTLTSGKILAHRMS